MTNYGLPGPSDTAYGKNATKSSKKKSPTESRAWIVGLIIFCIGGIAALAIIDLESETSWDPLFSPGTSERIPTPTESVPSPTTEGDTTQSIEDNISEALHVDVPTATVIYTEGDNTVHVIVPTMGGIRAQTKPILKAVKETGIGATLRIDAIADLKDVYGNTSPETVLRVMYSPETMERINPEGISLRNVWTVADESYVHPSLEW